MYYLEKNSLIVYVKITPNASRDIIDGIFIDEKQKKYLKVKVTTPPEDGKANKAVIKLLAKTFNIPLSCLSLIKGQTSRLKTIRVNKDIEKVKDYLNKVD